MCAAAGGGSGGGACLRVSRRAAPTASEPRRARGAQRMRHPFDWVQPASGPALIRTNRDLYPLSVLIFLNNARVFVPMNGHGLFAQSR